MLLQPLYVSSHHSFFLFSISCIQKYMLMFLFIIVDRGSLLNSYLIWREKQLMKYDTHPILNIYSSLSSILYSYCYISLLLFTYIFYVLLLIPSLLLFQVQECSFQLTQPKRRRLLFLRYFLLFLLLLFLISPSSLTYFFWFLLFSFVSFVFFRFLSFCFCFVSFFNFFLLTNFI